MNITKSLEHVTEKYDKALTHLGQEQEYPRTETLTVDNIIYIHDKLIEAYGGIYGVRDTHLLESVQNAPQQDIFGQELYPTVIEKAAKLLLDFCRYQIFLDGNKRTGIVTCAVLLYNNGYELTFTDEELYDFTMHIANNPLTEVKEIVPQLKDHMIKINQRDQKQAKIEESEYER